MNYTIKQNNIPPTPPRPIAINNSLGLQPAEASRDQPPRAEARGYHRVLVGAFWSAMIVVSLIVARGGFAANPAPTSGVSKPATSQPAAHNPTTRASQEVLDKLQQELTTVETIEADFVQEKQLKVLKHKLKITGHFALQKPDKLVWIVDKPVKYAIKVEGDELRQWDEDTNKVQIVHVGGDPTFKAITDQLQSWFLGDYRTLSESYDIYLENESPLTLGFTPKPGTMVASVLSHVDLIFSGDGKYLNKMIIREAGGDVTTLNYIDTKINQPIAKETWEIPPHGR